MSEFKQIGDLEVNEDIHHQHIIWKIQRIAWVVIALFLLAAMLGLFGRGYLSKSTAGEEGSRLWVKYERFERNQSPSRIQVFFGAGATREGKVRLFIDRRYMDSIEIKYVNPMPLLVEIRPDWYVYNFSVPDASRPVDVSFSIQPRKLGAHSAKIALESGPVLRLRQFFYP